MTIINRLEIKLELVLEVYTGTYFTVGGRMYLDIPIPSELPQDVKDYLAETHASMEAHCPPLFPLHPALVQTPNDYISVETENGAYYMSVVKLAPPNQSPPATLRLYFRANTPNMTIMMV